MSKKPPVNKDDILAFLNAKFAKVEQQPLQQKKRE
jgi:hypothetical protein